MDRRAESGDKIQIQREAILYGDFNAELPLPIWRSNKGNVYDTIVEE